MQQIIAAKKLLRKEMTTRLKSLSIESVDLQSTLVVNRVLSAPWYIKAKSISIYVSTSAEIQTDSLIKHALEQGKRLYIPYCPIDEPTVMRMLRLPTLAAYEGLKLNRWGIRDLDPALVHTLEDVDSEEAGGLDLILVPGLAFSQNGDRLGHGRGYYDRYISHCGTTYPSKFNKSAPCTAALALREQILPIEGVIPTNIYDIKPQTIITPDGSINEL